MKRKSFLAQCLTMITQVTFTMISPIIFCTFIGIWLDGKFGWSITIPCILLGFIGGGRASYILVKNMLKASEKESEYDR